MAGMVAARMSGGSNNSHIVADLLQPVEIKRNAHCYDTPTCTRYFELCGVCFQSSGGFSGFLEFSPGVLLTVFYRFSDGCFVCDRVGHTAKNCFHRVKVGAMEEVRPQVNTWNRSSKRGRGR